MPELTTAALEHLITEFFLSGGKQRLSDLARPFAIDELIRPFENLRRTMSRTLQGLTEAQVMFSPDANTYSVSEVVTHLISAQGNTYNAFLDIACSTLPHVDPVPRGPGAGAEKGVTAADLQHRLQQATHDLIDILRKTYNPAEEREVLHPIFSNLTYKGWMLFQLAHDLDHVKQAQTVRRSPSFPSKHAG